MLLHHSVLSSNHALYYSEVMDTFFLYLQILVQGSNAQLLIGSEDQPFQHNAVITLNGRRDDALVALAPTMILGSKAIGVFGNVRTHMHIHACMYTYTALELQNIISTKIIMINCRICHKS